MIIYRKNVESVYAAHPKYRDVYIDAMMLDRKRVTWPVPATTQMFYANRVAIWNCWYGQARQLAFEYFPR
jgi:hypothetical protein